LDRSRHIREAKAIAAVDHPNIITVHDVGEFEGRPFFTMEFIDGPHLGERIASDPLNPRQAATLVATLADAVHAGHLAGITHRDLKPSNVLLTADGIPKIADFGLARHLEPSATVTLGEPRFGTPSYMSPEQARGDTAAISASVDIYALGTILYECLTGRPPFCSKSPVETVRQVLEEDPPALASLRARVPRDLETICLKCLSKVPTQRYASAAHLADDLRRYLNGEPIHARPVSSTAKLVKWVLRHRARTAALFTLAVLLSVVMAGAIWQSSERSARASAAQQDLVEANRLLGAMSWEQANHALDRAVSRLGDQGPPQLQADLLQARRHADLGLRLEALRLERVNSASGYYDNETLDRAFRSLFDESGVLSGQRDSSEVVASRVLASPIKDALIDAIDLWAAATSDEQLQALLMEVVNKADASTTRKQLADESFADQRTLDTLVRSLDVTDHRPIMFIAFAWRVEKSGLNVVPLLTTVQRQYPTDVWINIMLGDALCNSNPTEAIRYYQAAIAMRPEASVIHNNLGNALQKAGRFEEARRAFEFALTRDVDDPIINTNLAGVLLDMDKADEAIALAQHVLNGNPDDLDAYLLIAEAKFTLGAVDESFNMFRTAMQNPAVAEDAWGFLFTYLVQLGRLDEARREWADYLGRSPADHAQWNGYAELCLYLEDDAAYQAACRQLLERFACDADPGVSERTGRACLLGELSADQRSAAVAAIERAMTSELELPIPTGRMRYYRVAGALAAYRMGDPTRSLALLDESTRNTLGAMPTLIRAMAQHELGQNDNARKSLAAAETHDDLTTSPDSREKWICHILMREAKALMQTTHDTSAR
jgi:serine/threonine-protein kinase